MRKEIVNALFNKTATEYDVLPVQHSNALQGALADQLTKGPRTVKRLVTGGGLGLLAGIVGDVIGVGKEPNWVPGTAAGAGLGLGLAGAGIYDAINRTYELSDDIKAYRGAEAKQQLAREEAKRKREQAQTVSKTASAWGDTAGKIVWTVPPLAGLGVPANTIGSALGALEGTQSEDEEKFTDKTPGMSVLPGVGAYRMTRRKKRQMTDPETGSTKHYWSAQIGSLPITGIGTSLIAPAILGAAIGTYALSGKDEATGKETSKRDAALAGAGLGAGAGILANVAGAPLAAFVTPRRTNEEQSKATKSWLSNLLVPGVGAYNKWKALGRAYGDSENREIAPPESTVNINFANEKEIDDERLKKIVAAAIANKA